MVEPLVALPRRGSPGGTIESAALKRLCELKSGVAPLESTARPDPPLTVATRSPHRPNPIGLHRVKVLSVGGSGRTLRVQALEAIDGTPILDLKPVLEGPRAA